MDWSRVAEVLSGLRVLRRVRVPPRDATAIRVPAGHVLRLSTPEGAQVGDLNLFADGRLAERFCNGKTRALHGSHAGRGHRLWFPI